MNELKKLTKDERKLNKKEMRLIRAGGCACAVKCDEMCPNGNKDRKGDLYAELDEFWEPE